MENWSENDSNDFVTYGDLFVPDRPLQFRIFGEILTTVKPLEHVVDLSCGEGLLAHHILRNIPACRVGGYDLSPVMLQTSQKRNRDFGDQFHTVEFDMTKSDWSASMEPVDAVVSSLAIHHLDDAEKETLFKDMYAKINPGGVLAILDIVKPTGEVGFKIAKDMWNEDVSMRSEEEGKPEAFRHFREENWNYFENPDIDLIDKPSTLLNQLKWMEAAGFKHVDVFWMYAGHALYAGWK